jgi:sulfatase modifying factor 1
MRRLSARPPDPCVREDDPVITVPAGRVTLTDRRTGRAWTVEVDSFRLAAYPVTRAECGPAGDRRPAESVSWWDAIRFCNRLSERDGLEPAYRFAAARPLATGRASTGILPDRPDGDRFRAGPEPAVEWDRGADGYRLPTEAEWEHACRAGTTGPRYGELDEIAWYRGNSGERVHHVGGKLPNAWGLYDLLGNVWEWCFDRYDAEVYGDYRVLRGGGWFDEHWSCRASVRRRSHPGLRLDDVGFRLARGGSGAAAGTVR